MLKRRGSGAVEKEPLHVYGNNPPCLENGFFFGGGG